ncbi:DUF5688 family protein [Butyrivibrio sp. AE3004]|uniref:DUF5688 family protein n=1 Tax=Butyrivibrio sp. AE3004 TaxID=1506994 RepID=UPI000494146E|nr:DUF5688 family protein [Butyrivibrio sp. AE3004]
MEKELFYNEVVKKVEAYYGDSAIVTTHEIVKNNGLVKRGLCVKNTKSNCAPTLYLDDFYVKYKEGRDFNDISEEVIETFDKYIVNRQVDMSFFKDYGSISDKICFKIVNKERNEEKLKNVPHRLVEDLAVIYFVALNAMGIDGSVQIRNEFLELWDATEEDLFEAALDNTPRIFPANIIPMGDFLSAKSGDDIFRDVFSSNNLLIATNDKYLGGASVMLYPGLLKEVGDKFGANFYILPSSVHELILLSETFEGNEADNLIEMVKCVNSTCVPSEDVLADSLYYFDRSGENNVKKVEQVKDTML